MCYENTEIIIENNFRVNGYTKRNGVDESEIKYKFKLITYYHNVNINCDSHSSFS